MQLRSARLCQDCEEIHEEQRCPVCASEAFAYIARWIPVPERRTAPRQPQPSPELEVYRQLIADQPSGRSTRLLKQALIGLTTVGVAGWVWRRSQQEGASTTAGAHDLRSSAGAASHGEHTRGNRAVSSLAPLAQKMRGRLHEGARARAESSADASRLDS